MGCAKSTISQELPEKLNWTRPDFDELCSKGENSLKLLNELKNGVLASWDRIASKFSSHPITPDLVYLLLLISFSYESKGDFISIDLHLAQTLPGFSKITSKTSSVSDLLLSWEDFCNELLLSVPKIHSIQEDIIQTAAVYYQVMSETTKGEKDELDEEVEDAVKQNLRILASGADFFHSVLNNVMKWIEKLCKVFSSIDDGRIVKIHAFARSLDSLELSGIVEKHWKALQEMI
jgi:hypothetical protein